MDSMFTLLVSCTCLSIASVGVCSRKCIVNLTGFLMDHQRKFNGVTEVISNDQYISIPETLLVKRELCTGHLSFKNRNTMQS